MPTKKRPLSVGTASGSKKQKTEDQVDKFLQKGLTAGVSHDHPNGYEGHTQVQYDQMRITRKGSYEQGPFPTERTSVADWERGGWTTELPGAGSNQALRFPVKCQLISEEDVLAQTPEYDGIRVLYCGELVSWVHFPRHDVDGMKDGRKRAGLYAANAVRWAKEGESSNCRFVLDPNWRSADPDHERVVLVSTHKVERGMEWRADSAYALKERGRGLNMYCSSEESEYDDDETSGGVGSGASRRALRSSATGKTAEATAEEYESQVWEQMAYNTDAILALLKERAPCREAEYQNSTNLLLGTSEMRNTLHQIRDCQREIREDQRQLLGLLKSLLGKVLDHTGTVASDCNALRVEVRAWKHDMEERHRRAKRDSTTSGEVSADKQDEVANVSSDL